MNNYFEQLESIEGLTSLPCQPLLTYFCRTLRPECTSEGMLIPCAESCYSAIGQCRAEIGQATCVNGALIPLILDDVALTTPEDACQFLNASNLFKSGYTCSNGANFVHSVLI